MTRKRCRRRIDSATFVQPSVIAVGFLGLLSARLATHPTALAAAQGPTNDCTPYQTEAVVSITFDDYPAEISWKITDDASNGGGGGGPIVVCARDFSSAGIGSRQTETDGCCLDHRYWEEVPSKDDGGNARHDDEDSNSQDDRSLQFQFVGREYTFTIADSYGDGMCCSHGRGGYAVTIADEIVVDGRPNGAFGSSASSSFVVSGGSNDGTVTPTPAPWWMPNPTPVITETMEPTDASDSDASWYPTNYPTVSSQLYNCPPVSVMGSNAFSSEFNGCINPAGCRFLATPYWDNGSFNEEACWYCCSSSSDQCGICSGCQCGYAPQTPAPTIAPSMDVATELPTYGYPPLDKDLSQDEAARIIWSDASRGTYPWNVELDCIVHPTYQYGRYEDLVHAMIRALGDQRLTWEIEAAIVFGNLDYWMRMSIDDDYAQGCVSLSFLADLIGEGDTRYVSDELRYKLNKAADAFVERMEREKEEEEGPVHWARYGVPGAIGVLFVGGIFICMRTFCDSDKTSDEAFGQSGNRGSGIAVAGSLVSSATISPSMAEIPPVPVASAVPIANGSGDDEEIAVTPVAKVIDMNYGLPPPTAPPAPSAPPIEVDGARPDPISSTPPGESLARCISQVGSFGRTEAIAEWMRDNPSLAAALSPEDIVLALSAISFSLDQPLAAKEIASGVIKAGGSITCGHVVKALGTCNGSARLDVAKGMAPFVSDLVNEEHILGLFESSFERGLVDRALNA